MAIRELPIADGEAGKRAEIPDDLWTRCSQCRHMMYTPEYLREFSVCTRCGYHARLSATERLEITVDHGSFLEYDPDLVAQNPLNFPEYEAKLAKAQKACGMSDALLTGEGRIGNFVTALSISNFQFMGGSMGSVVGEKMTRLFERALDRGIPVVAISSSGGARMQEAALSLMQMAKTCAAVARLSRAGLPYIVVLTDPSTAGVQASFASLGDVIIAEPGAYIGFTGARVIEQALRIKLPKDFQSAEFQLAHGMVDMVVHRRDLKPTLTQLLSFFAG